MIVSYSDRNKHIHMPGGKYMHAHHTQQSLEIQK